MTTIVYEKPRKARVVDASTVSGDTFKHGDIIDIYAERTDEDGDKFYYLSEEDRKIGSGWHHTRFELLEEDNNPTILNKTPHELTPCEKLGYKVGDKFVMTSNEGVKGFNIGDEIVLIGDDDSQCPKFFSHCVNDCRYILLDNVQKMINTTNFPIKEFLESMPKSASAGCLIEVGKTTVFVYGSEFVCTTEERLQEVMAALIVLYKEEV